MKKVKAKKFPRNPYAVQAHFKNSAGQMGDGKKEQSKSACRNWKEEPMLNKYKVTAHKTIKYDMIIDAQNENDALKIVDCFGVNAGEWVEDCESFSFKITSVTKIETEGEENEDDE